MRVLILTKKGGEPPESLETMSDEEVNEIAVEYDVNLALEELGHEIMTVGVSEDLSLIRKSLEEFKPHISFNLLEEFHYVPNYDHHVVSYLELKKAHYTGCNPRGLLLSRDKPLSKAILTYHRIRVPKFKLYPMGKKSISLPKKFGFPMIVKSALEDASVGISQSSVVYQEQSLQDRIRFVHEKLKTDALVEEFIDGREIYVGVLGNRRPQVLPVWEIDLGNLPNQAHKIATEKVKWDLKYQKKYKIESGPAVNISDEVYSRIENVCKKSFRLLGLSGYARMDLRLRDDGQVFLIEANPNPNLAHDEDFAESANKAGISFEELIQKIINLGLKYRVEWKRFS